MKNCASPEEKETNHQGRENEGAKEENNKEFVTYTSRNWESHRSGTLFQNRDRDLQYIARERQYTQLYIVIYS